MSENLRASEALEARNLRVFIGAKDFDLSQRFYTALGWRIEWETDGLAELNYSGCRFLLQRYYQKEWCHNTMLYMSVTDAAAWHRHAEAVIAQGAFDEAKVSAPRKEDYGALVTFLHDPSGVLWHLAQPLND